MKTIINKQTDIILVKADKSEYKMKYSDLIKAIINLPPTEGFTFTEMKTRLKILDVLEKKELKFEDAEFVIIKKAINEYKWSNLNKDAVEFVEYINQIK